jgi:putative tricarboxylic transport membrane protein
MARGSVVGFVMGLVPGPAAVMSSYASYSLERRITKHPERFGKGAVAGVAGPEAANNGASGGGMVPLLLLGVPFAPPTALLLAGFTIQGVAPGPLLVSSNPEIFWGIVAGMYVANILLLILNLPLVGVFAAILRMPSDLLLAGVALLAVVGTFAARNNIVDVFVLVAIGGLGYLMSHLGLPRATILLAFVVATVMEQSLGQTLTLWSSGSLDFASRPIAVAIFAITGLVLVLPYLIRLYGSLRRREPRIRK